MNDTSFDLSKATEILESTEKEFKVDFDGLWKWCGYSRKSDAKERLLRNFEENFDYEFCGMRRKTPDGGRPSELIMLTLDAAKEFAMLAQTSQGKEVRRYFIQAEKQLREKVVLPESPKSNVEKIVGTAKQLTLSGMFTEERIKRFIMTNLETSQPELDYSPLVEPSLKIISDGSAMVIPTEIAEKMGWYYKTGKKSPDARKVNQILKELGYQEKIKGSWQGTKKATDAKLCARKLVTDDSGSERDQLVWNLVETPLILKDY